MVCFYEYDTSFIKRGEFLKNFELINILLYDRRYLVLRTVFIMLYFGILLHCTDLT
jgi:hypothetical protein